MMYMEQPNVKIYIRDPIKDLFYELENLQDINDRTVLKVFEVDKNGIPCKSGNEIHEPITATVTVFKVSTVEPR